MNPGEGLSNLPMRAAPIPGMVLRSQLVMALLRRTISSLGQLPHACVAVWTYRCGTQRKFSPLHKIEIIVLDNLS